MPLYLFPQSVEELDPISLKSDDTGTPSSRNNVLFTLTDDGGFTFPYYNDSVAVMPAHAALAANGTVFDRAYTVVSSCSPSRASILSGLPNHQNGMYGLHNGKQVYNSLDGVRSLPTMLNARGYITGAIGKYVRVQTRCSSLNALSV